MYELLIAWKYLIPRWKQLSVSIISTISVLVIATVVWLILVFFSVTEGLEKGWMDKLTALTSPIRITPTEEYYDSFYYKIDTIAEQADYSAKSIREKQLATHTNPYDPTVDSEIPADWTEPDRNEEGQIKDLVKEVFNAVENVQQALGLDKHELICSDYEMAVSNIRLRLVRDEMHAAESLQVGQRFLSQASYLGSFDPQNPTIRKAVIPPTIDDLNNMLRMATITSSNLQQNRSDPLIPFHDASLRKRLHAFFDHTTITAIKPKTHNWTLPKTILPEEVKWQAIATMQGGRVHRVYIPQDKKQIRKLAKQLEDRGHTAKIGTLTISKPTNSESQSELVFSFDNGANTSLTNRVPLIATGDLTMRSELKPTSIEKARQLDDVEFSIQLKIQRTWIQGDVPFGGMTLSRARAIEYFPETPDASPYWLHHIAESEDILEPVLPHDQAVGRGVLIAKQFRENGVLLGDRGYISYYSPTTSSVQEQRIPVYVAGFYDPGIIPIGGKFITVDRSITSLIRSAQQQEESAHSNGISVRFEKLDEAPRIKKLLEKEFNKRGIATYWKIETFREFDFTRDIVHQLQSERNLFSLISMIIIVVACSNIISMLIILVNDKKVEIGILQSMGATAKSIALIFGTCGVVMGAVGSFIGTVAAIVTMKYLNPILDALGRLQGFDVLNKSFYGEMLPHRISMDSLTFVLIATALISLLAGVVPAVKAARMRPAEIMRKE